MSIKNSLSPSRSGGTPSPGRTRSPRTPAAFSLGFRVWELGFGVWDLGFGVWGLEFGASGLGFGAKSSGFRVWV